MSSNKDFVFSLPEDPMLRRMHTELPGLKPDCVWIHSLAGILWLDNARGIAKEDDYILVSRWIAGWLTLEFEVLNPELSRIQTEGLLGEDIDESSSEFERLISKPFKIRIPNDSSLPSNIQGRDVAIAVMSEDDTEAWHLAGIFAISKRADNTLVGPEPIHNQAVSTT